MTKIKKIQQAPAPRHCLYNITAMHNRRRARPFLLCAVLCVLLAIPARPQQSASPNAGHPGQIQATAKTPAAAQTPSIKPDPKKAKEAYQRGLHAESEGDWQDAYDAYRDAANWAPNDPDDFVRREKAKRQLVQMDMDFAERDAVSGRMDDARKKLAAALALDPTNTVIRARMAELSALQPSDLREVISEPEPKGEVHLEHQPGTRNFDIRGDTMSAYQEVARQFGVEVAFDVDLRSRPVRFRLSNLDFATAMRLLGEMTGTFWRPLTKHLFFVTEDTAQKRKDYDVSVVRTVMLPASQSPEQMTEILRLVRDIAGITRTDLDTRTGTMTMRASPQAITVAASLIEDLEKPPAEMILEVKILEVDKDRARQLGITPPQTAQIFTLSRAEVLLAQSSFQGLIQALTEVFGSPASLAGLSASQIASLLGTGQVGLGALIPPLIAFGGGNTVFLATLPGATAHFADMLSLVRHGRRVLLRAEDGKPATFFVGERFPVTLGQFSPSFAGTGSSVPGLISTNFPATNFTTGNGPSFVTTGDLQNQSIQDMIVANNVDNTLSVFLGNGDGTFQDPITPAPATGAGPVWIATGNFNSDASQPNNDTFLDLAVVNQAGDSVSILLGNGDGTFQAPTLLSTGAGSGPVAAVAANFNSNSDSFLDLAVVNHTTNTLSIFLGNGNGTFQAPTTIPTGLGPSSIAAADFNNDGFIDLAVTNQTDNTVSIFLGNGDGTFKPRTDYATGQAPVWVSTGDFSGDNILDLAVANNTDNTVSILFGNGDGTFQAGTAVATGTAPSSIAVADFNLDGRLDLAVTDQNDNAISILLGLGAGLFGPQFEIPVGTNPVAVATADFNGDGRPDLADANKGSNTATVILNSSNFSIGNALALTPFPGVEYLDIGLKMKATPRVHPNNEVTLKLNFEISNLTTQSFNGIPVIANQTVEQTVRVGDGQTVTLVKMLAPQETLAINGTPGLSLIPGLGAFTSDRTSQNQNSELVIMITPHMVSFAPRKDHVIYAGSGSLEGPGALGPTRQERQILPQQQPLQQQPPQQEPPPDNPPPQQ